MALFFVLSLFAPFSQVSADDPPILTLNGGVENVTVPGNTVVYFTWSDGSEVAIWNSLYGASGCSGTPEHNWGTSYGGNSVWVSGITLWYQARWIADPEVTSPCLSATWSDSATVTPSETPTETVTPSETPIGAPLLTLNGGTTSIEVPDYT
ncbi:MAG: hypothetical protein M9953_04350, partial [Thermomicrobiales bacterium]|nr:hypothetical protein [Thermomicrobiales bacterium]